MTGVKITFIVLVIACVLVCEKPVLGMKYCKLTGGREGGGEREGEREVERERGEGGRKWKKRGEGSRDQSYRERLPSTLPRLLTIYSPIAATLVPYNAHLIK